MYWYLFRNGICVGEYPYRVEVLDGETLVPSETKRKNLGRLRLENGQITELPPPPIPPDKEIEIEAEQYAPETVEMLDAIAGLYETLAERADEK